VRLLAVLGAVLLLATGCASSGTQGTGHASAPAGASSLPDVTLAGFGGGRSLALSGLKGPAVLNVWASWCGPCRRELPHYQAFSEKYAGTVKVFGIDFQDTRTDKAKALIRATGVSYPLYTDPGGVIRARALPELILVDARGHVAYRQYVEIDSVTQLEQLVSSHLQVSG
jgi:cytochrome c biogenesis protein CcmG/thiol:disulfide interchange protein DsbE